MLDKTAGRRVEIVITNTSSRLLKCKVGDRFFGLKSEKPDWLVGCYYVTVSDEDAIKIGEKCVTEGYSCRIIGEAPE